MGWSPKRNTIQSLGIEFQLSPYPLTRLPISTFDFCSIVGNLLDNAIEGIQRISGTPEKQVIHLTFSRSWDMFYIYCENTCDPSTLEKKGESFISSKKDTSSRIHGIGLHSIEAIAKNAEGRAEFHTEGNKFIAKIVLPYLDINH